MLPPFASLASPGSAGKLSASECAGPARSVESGTVGSEVAFSDLLSTAKSARAPLASASDSATETEDEPTAETEEPAPSGAATLPDAFAAWLLAPPPPPPAEDPADSRSCLVFGADGGEGESADLERDAASAVFARGGEARAFFSIPDARSAAPASEGLAIPAGDTAKTEDAVASDEAALAFPSAQAPRPRVTTAASAPRSSLRGASGENLASEASAHGSAVFSPIPVSRESGGGGQAFDFGKNERQLAQYQIQAGMGNARGMEKAKDSFAMTFSPAHESSTAVLAGAPESFATGTLDNAAPAATSLPAATAHLIERLEQVADRLADRPGEPIRLSLDLDGGHRVDVKVAMRGGRVFADFRSDSLEMRAALAQGWEAFVRGREGAAQRWADPVISGGIAPAPVSAASSRFANDSQHNSSASEQQPSADQRRSSRHDSSAGEEGRTLFARDLPARSGSISPASAQTAGGDASRILSARV